MNFPYLNKISKSCADRLSLSEEISVVGWIRWNDKPQYYWITNNERDKNNQRIDYLISPKDLL